MMSGSGSVGPNLGLKWGWVPGDSGWGTEGFNPGFALLDALVFISVKSATIAAPPATPAAGDRYIVAANATGAWAGKDSDIAVFRGGAWVFYPPFRGLRADVADAGKFFAYGTAWAAESHAIADIAGLQAALDAKAPVGSGGSSTARNSARLQAQWVSGAIVANDTVFLAFNAPYGGTVDSLDYLTGAGSFAVAIKINGVSVTGLDAVAVSNTAAANAVSTALNAFSAGAKITAVITAAAGSPVDALLNLNVTWA